MGTHLRAPARATDWRTGSAVDGQVEGTVGPCLRIPARAVGSRSAGGRSGGHAGSHQSAHEWSEGGRPKGSGKAPLVLAEFKKRRPTTPRNVSDSALAERIGKEFGLKKRASIKAIKPAKKPRSKPA